MRLISGIVDLVFPDSIYCIGCGAIIDRTRPYSLCDKCLSEYHFAVGKTCGKCGKILPENSHEELCPDCRTKERGFDRGYTCMMYGTYEREAIRAFKYKDRAYCGRHFGDLLYDRLEPELESINADVVCAVPLHPKKLAERGYNQAELVAERLAKRIGIPLVKPLERLKYTVPMARLGQLERKLNLESVFTVPAYKAELVTGKRVLLVDDIMTTGTTLDACGNALRAAGASYIAAATLAAGGKV